MIKSLRIPNAVRPVFVTAFWLAILGTTTLFAADTSYWIEPCTNPATSCMSTDVQLARWALEAWQSASEGKIKFVQAPDKEHALIRLVWATPEQGLYGETLPFTVDGRRGAQIFVRIVQPDSDDKLLRDTIVYLTCLHESGHALGLPHTQGFEDIMYSFQYGGNIGEYFGRYRRKLTRIDDIHRNSGLSSADRARLVQILLAK